MDRSNLARGVLAVDRLNRQVSICVDTNVSGDGHGFAGDPFGGFVTVEHCARRGECKVPARTDRRDPVFWVPAHPLLR